MWEDVVLKVILKKDLNFDRLKCGKVWIVGPLHSNCIFFQPVVPRQVVIRKNSGTPEELGLGCRE